MIYKQIILIVVMVTTILLVVVSYFTENFPSILKRRFLLADILSIATETKSTFICPLRGENWIVVTSIFYPTLSIHKFLNLTTEWNLIVIGDRKTPTDWQSRLTINSSRLIFLSIDQQKTLNYRILDYLPEGSYARKNIGYLVAIACGARVIFESDDDNQLDTNDIYMLPKISQPKHIPWIAFHRQRSPFINIYGSFGHPEIWPRGFPVDELRDITEDGWHSVRRNENQETYAYIQQFLADLDPDVDALYRLTHPLSIGRIKFDRDQPPVTIQPFTFSPYNTQNTITHYEAFWGLYLPVTTTFRVCDIWRGFWVQRLLWDIGGQLVFGTSTVSQVRNSHSYIADMDDEEQLYHQSGSFVRFLSSWSSSLSSFSQRIAQLANDIAEAKFWHAKEVDIVNAWLYDLQSVNYSFPSVVSPTPPIRQKEKRAAICVTGLAECFQNAWTETETIIRKHLSGATDTFLFLSSSVDKRRCHSSKQLKQVRTYINSTVTILYEDRIMDPRIPSNCSTYLQSTVDELQRRRYYEELWALSECFDLVKEYENKMGICYELLFQTKPNVLLTQFPTTLKVENRSIILSKSMNDQSDDLNDNFTIGLLSTMKQYMKRWHHLKQCSADNFHEKKFLRKTLDRFNITIQFEKNLSFTKISNGSDGC